MTQWTFLAEGTYNKAYVNAERTKVFKVQKKTGSPPKFNQSDSPERVVRLWNIVNPQLSEAYIEHDEDLGYGVIYPYVEGRQSSDEEMARAVVDIYNKTGRIVTDATARKNFLTTADGKVVCIDIALAVQLERECAPQTTSIRRTPSIVSMDTWISIAPRYGSFFWKCDCLFKLSKTVSTVKALLFIKCHQPEMSRVDFLLDDTKLLTELSKAYDEQICKFGENSFKSGLPSHEALPSTITNAQKKLQLGRGQEIKNSLRDQLGITALPFAAASVGTGFAAVFFPTAVLGGVGTPILIALAFMFATIALSLSIAAIVKHTHTPSSAHNVPTFAL